MKLTIDSSVFVEVTKNDLHRQLCLELLRTVYKNEQILIIEPAIFLFEFINATGREGGSPADKRKRTEKAEIICRAFLERRNFTLWPHDKATWQNWLEKRAGSSGHPTNDEFFLYTANIAGSHLITLDKKVLHNSYVVNGRKCSALAPYDCLKMIRKKYPEDSDRS